MLLDLSVWGKLESFAPTERLENEILWIAHLENEGEKSYPYYFF